jgi:hypothetical protein
LKSTFRAIRGLQSCASGIAFVGQWSLEVALPLRRLIVLCVLLGAIIFGWLGWRHRSSQQHPNNVSAVTVIKQPVSFTTRTFDPATPPADMPPLAPGEAAMCDSNFISNASVAGESRKEDATHALVTITHVDVTLQLNGTIWVPIGVTQHVIEHEDGHRQISEHFYLDADKLAEKIAATYVGKQVEVSGADLNAESNKILQQSAADITDEYDKELNPNPTQLLYDDITDHSRNDTVVKDAIAAAIQNAAIASAQPTVNPAN